MRRALAMLLAALVLLSGGACGEAALELADTGAMEEFAREHLPGWDVGALIGELLSGGSGLEEKAEMLLESLASPLREALGQAVGLLAPALMIALAACMRSGGGAVLPLRLGLLAGMLHVCAGALAAAQECLETARDFSATAAPALSALTAAMGLGGSGALISPGAALAGQLIGELFLKWGMPLCRLSLGLAAAGSLSPAIDLSRAVKLLRRIGGWGIGLCFTLFAALVALRGGMAVSLDGMALRTAKYAVDSATPVIGSGVSELWDSYAAGLIAAKSAVGISGVMMLAAATAGKLVRLLAAILLLEICGALLELLGEGAEAAAAERMAGVCRLGMELSCGAIAVVTVLLGAVLTLGRGLAR